MISDSDRTERLYVMLPPEVLKAIDDFRFANRIQNRAAAVRELLRRGLRRPVRTSIERSLAAPTYKTQIASSVRQIPKDSSTTPLRPGTGSKVQRCYRRQLSALDAAFNSRYERRGG